MTAPLDLDDLVSAIARGIDTDDRQTPQEYAAAHAALGKLRAEVERLRLLTDAAGGLMESATAELERLRAGGCARGQHPAGTQFCAEASKFARERDEAHARGVADERARVVADLLWQASDVELCRGAGAHVAHLHALAERYERGDHAEGGSDV